MVLITEYKKLMKNLRTDKKLLVPLLQWSSGKGSNIELSQKINKLFFSVDKQVLSDLMSTNNKVSHFIKYPKNPKKDDKTEFFYRDLASYYGWTLRELMANLDVIDVEDVKEEIATKFGYDNAQRRAIKIKSITNANKFTEVK